MRVKINNINDLTDSREILESKPNPFVPIFIFLLVALLICTLVWSYFGEMDTVAKANGIVRPNEKVHTIQAPLFGKVEELNIKEGQSVKKGDVLFSLEQEEVLKELENRKAESKDIEVELKLLNTYKASVQAKKNLFSKPKGNEDSYSKLVEQYIANYNQMELDFQNSYLSVEQEKNTLNQSSKMIDVNIIENERNSKNAKKKYEAENKSLVEKINKITLDLENERKLRESITTKQNHLNANDSVRNSQLVGYEKKLEQLTLVADEFKKTYNRSVELGERFVSKVQIEKEKNQYENALIEVENFVNNSLLDLDTNIKGLEVQLQQVKADLDTLNKTTDLAINNDGLYLEKEHINENIQSINTQQGVLNQTEQEALKKFELDKTVEINKLIEEEEKKKEALTENIEQLEITLNKGGITATVDGTINIIKEISVGEFLQSGEEILSIIPDQESKYKVSLAVPNQEIGKISIGDKVNFHFSAFPKQNFGYLSGKISSISSDSTIGENGISYYTVEASLLNKPLIGKKGESGNIKVGMTAQASVITDSKKIINYVLEKLNFID